MRQILYASRKTGVSSAAREGIRSENPEFRRRFPPEAGIGLPKGRGKGKRAPKYRDSGMAAAARQIYDFRKIHFRRGRIVFISPSLSPISGRGSFILEIRSVYRDFFSVVPFSIDASQKARSDAVTIRAPTAPEFQVSQFFPSYLDIPALDFPR
jgi:hypothetical protein